MKVYFLNFLIIFLVFQIINKAFSQQLFTIEGIVRDFESGDPVYNANISVSQMHAGTSTDKEGYFKLMLPEGKFIIKLSYIGFAHKELSIQVPMAASEPLIIGLKPVKIEMDNVDVFGNSIYAGLDTSINKIPVSILPDVTQVRATDIEKQGSVTLTDAMKYTPGGWTETRGRKVKQFYSVRGQKYPYPDYSIDGVWQKEFEETAYFLSALDIESVEIVRSSNALVKGLSGLTGVVDIKTRKPDRESISFLTKYGNHNQYVANLQYGNKINKVSFNTATVFFGTDGLPGRGGKERIANFHGNMEIKINNRLNFSAAASYIQGSREFVRIIEPGIPSILNRKEKYDPLRTLISYARFDYTGNDGSQTELQTSLTFRDADYESFNIQQETTTTHSDKDREYGFNLLHSRMISPTNRLRIGFLYNDWEAPDGKRFYAGRRCHLYTYSGVVTSEQKIRRFLLDAGLRLIGGYIDEWGGFGIEGSASGLQSVAPIENQPAQVEWQAVLGGSYVLSDFSSIHYNFSGGTIAPREGSLKENGETPDYETRIQHDLGFRYRSQKQNEITISAFFTKRGNAINLSGKTITTDDNLIIELYENQDKRSFGAEIAARLNVQRLRSSVFANAMLMKGEINERGKNVDDDQLPNAILNAGILYEHSGIDINLFIHYTGPYTNNRFVNPLWVAEHGDYPLGDFVSANLTAGYSFPGRLSTRAFVEVNNILDEKYETVAGYPDAGRLFQAGVRIRY